jgi:hypothetical protein
MNADRENRIDQIINDAYEMAMESLERNLSPDLPNHIRDQFIGNLLESRKRTISHTQITRELKGQSDRGLAIMGGAYVEDALKDYLEAHWRKGDDAAKAFKNLTQPSRALGSFSAKIDIAYLTHLIDTTLWKDLTNLKNIRNDFAHKMTLNDREHEPLTFTTGSISARCNNFILTANSIHDDIDGVKTSILPDSSRNKYLLTVLQIYTMLNKTADIVNRFGAQNIFFKFLKGDLPPRGDPMPVKTHPATDQPVPLTESPNNDSTSVGEGK